MRVISLVPSVTETLLAWNVDVVACTRFCEQPTIAHVGGTKDPDVDAIVALAPDLVVVDREENRRDDAAALVAAGVAVHVTHVVDVAEVPATLRRLAAAVGVEATFDDLRAGAASTPAAADGRTPTAFVPIWRRPTMTIGAATYASTLLRHLGVGNVMAGSADVYPTVELADVAGLAPDLVLLPSEPYPFAERHRGEYQRAVPRARVVLIDGQDLFWWGVRTVPAIERLTASLRAVTTPS